MSEDAAVEEEDSTKKMKKPIPGSDVEGSERLATGDNLQSESGQTESANEDVQEEAGQMNEGQGEGITVNLPETDEELADTRITAPVKPEKLSKGLITLYQKNQMDTYKEAAQVIGISVLLTMVIYILTLLKRK